MPFTTGTVSTFANKFINAPETIGTGDDIETIFSYTVSKPVIFISGVKIEYTIATTTYQVTSDSSGVFTGTGISSGTVTEAGLISLTFSTPPDDTTLIRVLEYTTKGILQKLKDFVCTSQDEETIGTGDDIETIFSGTLSNASGIGKGQAIIKFKIAGVVYWAADDGSGNYDHPYIVAGSIDYTASAAFSFEFTNPIDDLFGIKLLYAMGAEGQDWLIFNEDISQDNVLADAFPGLLLQQMILRNSGSNYYEHNVFGFRESQYLATNQFLIELNFYKQWGDLEDQNQNWNVNAFRTGYDATREHWSTHPSTAFNDVTMTYWIKATKDIIFLGAKVSGSIYTNFYVGGGKRLSSRDDNPNPKIIIGNLNGNFSFTNTGSTHTFVANPTGTNSAWIIDELNNYLDFSDFTVIPTNEYVASGDLKRTRNNKIIPHELYVVNTSSSPNRLLFEIIDIFHTPYLNFSSEDTLEAGTYIVFQNIFRTATENFFAVKK